MPDNNPTACYTCGFPISGENVMVTRSLDVFCKKCYQKKIQEKIKDGIDIHIRHGDSSAGTLEGISTPLKVVPPGYYDRFIQLDMGKDGCDVRKSKK
jgi:hypothetical protein